MDLQFKQRNKPEYHRQDQSHLWNDFSKQIQEFVCSQNCRITFTPEQHAHQHTGRNCSIDQCFQRHRIIIHKKQNGLTAVNKYRIHHCQHKKQTEEKKQFFYNFARSISDAEQQHSANYGCRDHHRMHADHGKSDSQCIVQKLYGRMITFIPIHFASPSPADSFSVSCFSESVLFPFFLFF